MIKGERYVGGYERGCLLGMENCLYSGWPQEADCAECDAATAAAPPPVLPWLPLPPPHLSASFQFHGFPSWSAHVEKNLIAGDDRSDDRTATASKSHSQAEKRRRDRINAQLATLRKLIPKSEKVLDSLFICFSVLNLLFDSSHVP